MLIRSPRRLLLIAASLLVSAGLVFSKEIDLWFVPMSQEGPQTPGLLAWAKEHFPKDLPKGVTVPGNYGPPIYQDAQQKFIVQGRRGKPDVIEGVLEGMIAYQKPASSPQSMTYLASGRKRISLFPARSKRSPLMESFMGCLITLTCGSYSTEKTFFRSIICSRQRAGKKCWMTPQ